MRMPDTMVLAGKRLTLNGMGLREATVFNVNVYVAGLYLETVSSNANAIVQSNQVKILTLRFVRDVDRGDITKAWRDGFKNNATVKLATIQPLIDRLNAWMPDFSDGDVLTFSYVPDTGVTVVINGQVKGTINHEEFARSLFSIWLGQKPPTKALRSGLLGKHGATS
ncbi:MAG: chalcone isomerase family protein [Myxococcales bacterium]|nr:chalcone isomerase family protein [Myxococcales bacterium]